ncbi:MAG: hypothetical protein IJN27_01865 [Oscillospiraceae bacterium]|nr:hypothetical protein [Oscillospiraceae bacterium]
MDKWTGVLIGKMHNNRVANSELAKELGMSEAYVSMVLNCSRKPPNAKERFNEAYERIIARRKECV